MNCEHEQLLNSESTPFVLVIKKVCKYFKYLRTNSHYFQVIERAKEGESLEELRARTAAQFSDDHNGFQGAIKLSKKRKDVDILDEGKMKFGRFAE